MIFLIYRVIYIIISAIVGKFVFNSAYENYMYSLPDYSSFITKYKERIRYT